MKDRFFGTVLGRAALFVCAFTAQAALAQALQPQPPAAPAAAGAPVSAAAEGIYAGARSSLLQIRTLVEAANRQSSIGSGFAAPAGRREPNPHPCGT